MFFLRKDIHEEKTPILKKTIFKNFGGKKLEQNPSGKSVIAGGIKPWGCIRNGLLVCSPAKKPASMMLGI
jgi:hypothetical protein